MSDIIIYQTKDRKTEIEVKFDQETVWLSQVQIVELFGSSKANISEHLSNIFKTRELEYDSTVRKFRIVRIEGARKVTRDIEHYNLDVIISVGYRVNTKNGIHFRQWATQRLKDFLIKGAAINQKRLDELQQTITLISKSGKTEDLHPNEAKGLLEIINKYTNSFVLLNQFDGERLDAVKLNEKITYEIKYEEAISAINSLKQQLIRQKEATELFGNEKDDGFKSSLRTVVQTFGGQYLYS